MTRNTICSECGGKMEKGHVVTELDAWGRIQNGAFWLEGDLARGILGFVKTEGKRQYYLLAYRCERCGLMKFYAGPDQTAQENS
jgi:hypothetical protein